MDRYLLIAGRALLSLLFLMSGFGKIANWSGTRQMMAAQGIPLPDVSLAIAAVCEIVGGLALLTGFGARWASLLLFLYLIPVTATMHAFWAADAAHRQNQMIHFMKNVAIAGGLLAAAAASSRSVADRTSVDKRPPA